MAKVTHKASTMGLLKKQKLERRFWNAKLVLFEKKTLMQIEIINPFVYLTFCKNWSKEWVGRIQRFDVIKTQDIYFESCKKACVFARQGVHYHIFFALLVFDNVRKRLHELNPFCVPFTQIGLALKILQRLMVGMDDKFFGPKIVLPHLKNSNQGKKFFVINGIV